jgi:hypothetical protein
LREARCNGNGVRWLGILSTCPRVGEHIGLAVKLRVMEVCMSGIKRLMEKMEEQRMVATQIAVEAGILKRCEFHGEVYDTLAGDNTPAYKLGNYKFSAHKLDGIFSDRREMTDAIDAAVNDTGDECYFCAKFWNE